MIYEKSLSTKREDLINITRTLQECVSNSGIESGICYVHCPHTTAGITINENADPDVIHDLLIGLDEAFPDRREFRHMEGNSSAHLKSSSVGPTLNLIIEKGRLVLGVWQGVYFCEFDGPRNRKYFVKIIEG